MRKNHHGKKDRLVKRVFALCLALAVICTCLVPVFATEGLSDLQVEKELPGTSEEEAAGFGDDFPAVDDGEPREVYDDSEAAGFGEEEASRPVEGGEDNLDGGPTVTDSEWGTVIDYSTSTSTSTDSSSSTETQWSGEDDVVEKPDDKVVVSGDEIKKLQDMVVYRFWLRELNTLDLQDITAQAQINNMTESEYLARNGEVLWNLYFIQAVPRVETIADYSSYIENPSSNRDPKGELRQFDYWYTLDEFGNRVHLNLTDPTSNILDDKTTTVNVYAAWKDGTVGSDEEESVDHEDLVDKNPVPVDLETKAAASYKDEDGNTKSVNLPVEVKNLPSAAHSLSVIHMGDDDMQTFYESHEDSFGEMMPILGLKISPKNAKGEKVQLAEGEKATVTVSGLDKLPEIAAMEEEEALTADALKVLHQKADNTVEKLDVVSYENGTLTFETSSFSPFVLALTGGYDVKALELTGDEVVTVGQTITLKGSTSKCSYSSWESSDNSIAKVDSNGKVTGVAEGWVTITHKYCNGYNYWESHYHNYTSETKKVYVRSGTGNWVYIYTKVDKDSDTTGLVLNNNGWYTLGRIYVTGIGGVEKNDLKTNGSSTNPKDQNYKRTGNTKFDAVMTALGDKTSVSYGSAVERYGSNTTIDLKDIDWTYYGLVGDSGAINYVDGGNQWHLDGLLKASTLSNYTVNYYIKGTSTKLKDSLTGASCVASIGTTVNAYELGLVDDTIPYHGQTYGIDSSNPENAEITIVKDSTKNVINLYYTLKTSALKVSKSVTGLLGEKSVDFKFRLYIKSTSASYASDATWEKHTTDTNQTISSGNSLGVAESYKQFGGEQYAAYAFVLKHNETIEFNNLPVGAYLVEEDDYSGSSYTTTYILDGSDPTPGNTVMVELQNSGAVVKFTNERTLKPDTGVLLDTLPYIVILAVVAGGVALLMLRKHRKEDD